MLKRILQHCDMTSPITYLLLCIKNKSDCEGGLNCDTILAKNTPKSVLEQCELIESHNDVYNLLVV